MPFSHFNVKMGGQELFSKSDMGGHTLFSRTKMGGQGVFFYQNITDFPGDLPINFGHSLTVRGVSTEIDVVKTSTFKTGIFVKKIVYAGIKSGTVQTVPTVPCAAPLHHL